jgi:hypothetical protein
MADHEERIVRVHNKACTITISHTSKTAWIVVGDYMGKRVEVVGSSAITAARRWAAAARCKGNGLERVGRRRHSRQR